MKNQLKTGVILSYVTVGVNMLVQLVYTPVMLRLLGKSEYGLYNLVGSVVSYLSLFSFGFSGAYLRFYTRARHHGKDETARVNGTFLLAYIALSGLALFCGLILTQFTRQLFGTKLNAYELYTAKILMYILVFNITLTLISSLFDAMISAREMFFFQRVLSLTGIILNPMISLPLLLLGYGSVAVVAVTAVITCIKFAVNIYYCIHVLGVKFCFSGLEFSLLKEISVFSFFLFLNMIIDQINWNIDKYILGRTNGTEEVAVYGLGSQINSMVIAFSTAISSVFSPRIHRIANGKAGTRDKEFTELFIKVGRIQFLLLALISSGFVIFGDYFICSIYAGPEYKNAYPVAAVLIIPALIPYIQNLGIEIQRSQNKHQIRSIVYLIMAVFNMLVSIPLAIRFGSVGSAIGTALSMILGNGVFMNVFYHRSLGINILKFWQSILQLFIGMVPALVAGGIIIYADLVNSLTEFVIYICIYTLVYCAFMMKIGMNEYEKNLIVQLIKLN